MAIIKHIAIKNSNYDAAADYLTTKHDEFTSKPVLDERGRRIPRESFLIEGINCNPYSFGRECEEVNARFGKNQTKEEIKAHHYIISFDPHDRDENGLTMEHAQELGMAFARKNFPGHQVLVCTHPDGHGNAGNIHVHIVLNSVRAMDVPLEAFMERPSDALAGNKHHVTKDFLEYLKKQTMEMCQQENLNQVNLLSPAKVRITDREYWAQRRGQHVLDEKTAATGTSKAKYQTRNMLLREQIHTTMMDSHSFNEFAEKLLANYGIMIQESRGQISYHLPDKVKPIRGKTLGTDFERTAILRYYAIGMRFTDDPTIHSVTDLSDNPKAQSSKAYTNAVKRENLKQMSKALIYLQENGISPEELEEMCTLAADAFQEQSSKKDSFEQQFKKLKAVDKALQDYYKTKAIHKEYLQAKDKKQFREDHYTELALYDAAVKDLRSFYGDQKFPSRKAVSAQLHEMYAQKNDQYETYCMAREQHRKMQALRTNYRAMLSEEISADTPEKLQTLN